MARKVNAKAIADGVIMEPVSASAKSNNQNALQLPQRKQNTTPASNMFMPTAKDLNENNVRPLAPTAPATTVPPAQVPYNNGTYVTQPVQQQTQGSSVEQKKYTYDPFSYDEFSYGDYYESDAVRQANAMLQQQQANKPGAYQSQWRDQIDAAFDAYTNRDPFSYDFNADALYQQYKDNYIQQGQMAMMDTMGQAAAMTGGYGNSYAQSVGQQAYNQYLNQLNNVIPELYQQAYNRYDQEGTDLYNRYNMLLAKENKDYARYQDQLSNWYKDLDYLTNRYETERNLDYGRWESGREQAYDEYKAGRDAAWDEYVTQLERDKAAAEMMAGLGQYDRLGEMYGLTNSEVAAIQAANAPKPTGGGGGSDNPVYTKLTREDRTYWEGAFKGAENLADVEWYANQMQNEGYDPAEVASWYDRYAAGLTPEQPQQPPKTGSWRDQDEYWRTKSGATR